MKFLKTLEMPCMEVEKSCFFKLKGRKGFTNVIMLYDINNIFYAIGDGQDLKFTLDEVEELEIR